MQPHNSDPPGQKQAALGKGLAAVGVISKGSSCSFQWGSCRITLQLIVCLAQSYLPPIQLPLLIPQNSLFFASWECNVCTDGIITNWFSWPRVMCRRRMPSLRWGWQAFIFAGAVFSGQRSMSQKHILVHNMMYCRNCKHEIKAYPISHSTLRSRLTLLGCLSKPIFISFQKLYAAIQPWLSRQLMLSE